MVSETAVLNRYKAHEQEIVQLDHEIQLLQLRVRMGSDQWRGDLELLAQKGERRRSLEAQCQALSWVLSARSSLDAPAQELPRPWSMAALGAA